MRQKLKQIGRKDRHVFTGVFERTGMKNGYKGPEETLLLLDVKDEHGNVVTDHLWFNFTKGFREANPEPGDVLEFRARVDSYVKGYDEWSREVDYRLTYPTAVKNTSQPNRHTTWTPPEPKGSEKKDPVREPPTENQLRFIERIREVLNLEPVVLDSKQAASDYIDAHYKAYKQKEIHPSIRKKQERQAKAKELSTSGHTIDAIVKLWT